MTISDPMRHPPNTYIVYRELHSAVTRIKEELEKKDKDNIDSYGFIIWRAKLPVSGLAYSYDILLASRLVLLCFNDNYKGIH